MLVCLTRMRPKLKAVFVRFVAKANITRSTCSSFVSTSARYGRNCAISYHLSITVLLTNRKYIAKAVLWGIIHFDIPMFTTAKEELLTTQSHPIAHRQAQKLAFATPSQSRPDYLSTHSRPHRPRRTKKGLPRQGLQAHDSSTIP